MKFFWISIFILPSWTISCNVENCIQCSSSSPNICLQCQPSYNLSRTACTYSEFNLLDQVSNCEIRTEDSKCEKCSANYHIYQGFCQADCDEGCSCYEPNICEENAFNENSEKIIQALTQCPPGCSRCDFSDYCYKCEESYTLYSGQCIWCPDSNCLECYSEGECNECEAKYYISSGFCAPCSSHCKRCDGWLSCDSCESGYKLRNGICDDDDDDDDDDNGTSIAVGIIVLIVILSVAGVSAIIIGIVIYRKRRMNRLASQHQIIMAQQPAVYHAHPIPNQPTGYSPPAHSNVVIGSVRVVQLDGRNMVMGQGNCSFCRQSLRTDVETVLLPCNHAFHGQCVQNMISSRGFRACSVCNMQFA